MKRHAKAPSSGSSTRKAQGLVAIAFVCVAFLGIGASAANAEETECGNENVRIEQNSTALPDCRAYEMVSPIDKNGVDVTPLSSRVHAAADGNALVFPSLGGFADVRSTGVEVDYLSERTGLGSTGWSTHAITPLQGPLETPGEGIVGGRSYYDWAFTPDLSKSVYHYFGARPEDENVQDVFNLYLRNDLRTPGPGHYQLLTSAISAPVGGFFPQLPVLDGASADLTHIAFESAYDLTSDAPPQGMFCWAYGFCQHRLYEWVNGDLRFAGVLPDGSAAASAIGGAWGSSRHTPNVVSPDGSRLFFTAEGALYARIGGAVTVQLNRSENPGSADEAAQYGGASTDGKRVFFRTKAGLLPGDDNNESDFYMWKQADTNETQTVTVDASGGSFALSLYGRSSGPIAAGASAAAVQAALEAINGPAPGNYPLLPQGDVSVTGPAGGPYAVTFEGDLAGVNVPEMVADSSALTGGAATATVATTAAVANLTRISNDESGEDQTYGKQFIGASADGSYAYFIAGGRLIPEAEVDSPYGGGNIYVWHEGDLAYIGSLERTEDAELNGSSYGILPPATPARVSPNGHFLLFASHSDVGLAGHGGYTGADHGTTADHGSACNLVDNPEDGACRELYVYDATTGSLRCASCRVGAPAAGEAVTAVEAETSASVGTYHLSQILSDDGHYVFFTTNDALVPEDTNGTYDVYEYDTVTETQHLISSGLESQPSYLMDTSPSGHDVYFNTREPLSGWDIDGNRDVYDARIGGGFSEPPLTTAPCEGDACRSARPASVPAPTPGSATQQGPGDPKPTRCPRGKRPVHRAGKTTCVKKHAKRSHRRHRRYANHDRRVAR